MRKITFSFFSAAILLIFSTCLWAQDQNEILDKIKQKYDGFEKSVKDMELVMQIDTTATGAPVKAQQSIFRKGDKVRIESVVTPPSGTPSGPKKTVFIFDGKDTWMLSAGKDAQKLPPDASAQMKTDEKWWDRILGKAKVKGEEKIAGRDAYVIEIPGEKGGPPSTLWVDKNALVLLQAQSQNEQGKPAKWVFSDFRKIDGWEMPFKTEMYVGGALQSTSIMKSFQINKGVSDDLFNPQKKEAPGKS